ncbi:lipopolysaccharide biosynthesis protein [Aliarcobacter butzleri]|uniref:lipopolysaccharide biosynthesis protein n=1 Tax=Aliarcobacter butzleri TaxID=28197 RepID=UPI0028CB20B4|nr:oligosaccharide flippase family protein [Aliarcobacter butzleri]
MKKKLFKDSLIYILGDTLNKATLFLMLPILTRYLTPEDYGFVSVFTVLVSVLAVFTGLSIQGAINVNYFKYSKEELQVYIGNCVILLNISTLIVFIVIGLFHPFILVSLSLTIEWLVIAIILAYGQFLTTINLILWIAEQKPKEYSLYQIAQTLIITVLTLLLVIVYDMSWQGQLIAITIGTLIFSFISFIFLIKRQYLNFCINKEHIIDALKFGVPLIPHALSGLMKTGADRMIIMGTLGAAITGIYSVGYQLGMVIGVLVAAFNKAWAPYLFRTLSNSPSLNDKVKIVQFSYLYFVSILIIAFLFSYISILLVPFLLGEEFVASSELIIYFAMAFAFDGMYYMVTNYLFFVKKTHILAYVTFITSLFHIVLLMYLIKVNGILGAAQASLISYGITFFSVWFLAHKYYPMPWLEVFKVKESSK